MRAFLIAPLLVAVCACAGGSTGGGNAGSGGSTGGAAGAGGGAACDEAKLHADPKHCGRCGHDCLGGACTQGVCAPVVVASGLEQPPQQMLAGGGALSFVIAGDQWATFDRIFRVSLPASAPVELTPSPFISVTGKLLTVGENLYFLDSDPTNVGSYLRIVANDGSAPEPKQLQSYVYDLAYGAGRFMVSNFDYGYIIAISFDSPNSQNLVMDVPSARELAVDAEHVYFVADYLVDIRRVPLGGGPIQAVVKVVGDSGVDAIAVDAAHLYFISSGKLYRAPKAGGSPDSFATDASAIALDEGFVYHLATGTGAVLRTPKQGGPTETLVQAGATVFALDDVSVLWAVKNSDGTAVILRQAKP